MAATGLVQVGPVKTVPIKANVGKLSREIDSDSLGDLKLCGVGIRIFSQTGESETDVNLEARLAQGGSCVVSETARKDKRNRSFTKRER